MGNTRERVLESACEIFAEKGYLGATIAEICEQAEANIALVNYHFGCKESLYRETLKRAFLAAEERFPLDGGLGAEQSPEARLRTYVRAVLLRAFSQGVSGYYYRMLAHEFSNPHSPVNRFFKEWNRPQWAHLKAIVQEISGVQGPSKDWLRLCAININSLCLYFSFNQRVRKLVTSGKKLSMVKIERLVNHITQFASGGVLAVSEPFGEPMKDFA